MSGWRVVEVEGGEDDGGGGVGGMAEGVDLAATTVEEDITEETEGSAS